MVEFDQNRNFNFSFIMLVNTLTFLTLLFILTFNLHQLPKGELL